MLNSGNIDTVPSVMKIKDDYIQYVHSRFPKLELNKLRDLISDNLISPFTVELSQSVLNQAQDLIDLLWKERQLSPNKSNFAPGNHAICMSYDFHLDQHGRLKLIEVNTNAAFLFLGTLLYESRALPKPIPQFQLNDLRQSILNELSLWGRSEFAEGKALPRIAIIDDQPEAQRLFAEFLVAQELIRSWGWTCDIVDFRNLGEDYDFIYNRYTDFLFSHPHSQHLLNLYQQKKVCFSPNPNEYSLLADKQRLIEWSQKLSSPYLPKCVEVNPQVAEELWTQRKQYFFKPKQSFGSKQTYRGEKISRKAFDSLLNENFIGQEYIPAPELDFEIPSPYRTDATTSVKLKYDLRFYTYENQIQSVIARLYQGQVTNLQAPLGGFAAVKFI